jgi:hypothetical protein
MNMVWQWTQLPNWSPRRRHLRTNCALGKEYGNTSSSAVNKDVIELERRVWAYESIVVGRSFLSVSQLLNHFPGIVRPILFPPFPDPAMASNGSSTVSLSLLYFLPVIASSLDRSRRDFSRLDLATHTGISLKLRLSLAWVLPLVMHADGRGDGEQLGAGQAAALFHLQPSYPPGPSLEAIRHSNFFSPHSSLPFRSLVTGVSLFLAYLWT